MPAPNPAPHAILVNVELLRRALVAFRAADELGLAARDYLESGAADGYQEVAGPLQLRLDEYLASVNDVPMHLTLAVQG